ncbi:MAG: copper amine oxidase N-terminal domain-containing protein, partial [Desulfitobacteriaceae bacterium]|nr:copper amine oxidase N-terminal domain-containing protein [Desulfitobacteriaceae bacterium]
TLDIAFEGTEYIALSMQEYNVIASNNIFKQGTNFFSLAREQQNIILNNISDFSMEVYDNYQTGLVRKTDKGYAFSVDPEGAVKCFQSILVYTINNIEKFGACLTDSITALTDDQMRVLGLEPNIKNEILSMIDPFVANVKENRSNYLEFINEIGNEKEYIDAFKGSEITMSLEKEVPETYATTTLFRIVFQDPVDADNKFDCSINSQSVMSACEPFDVIIPEQGVITIAELEKRMSQVMSIKTGNGDYTLTYGPESIIGRTEVKMINNQTYLPLREVGEALNESVNWDGKMRRAYVERNGRQIDMTGTNINSRIFIKIRDFEKLGYQVQWEAETKTVTIIKQNIF